MRLTFHFVLRWQTSRSQVDRIVLTRYYAFLVISQFFIFSLITVFVNLGVAVASEVRDHKSFSEIYEANIASKLFFFCSSFVNGILNPIYFLCLSDFSLTFSNSTDIRVSEHVLVDVLPVSALF